MTIGLRGRLAVSLGRAAAWASRVSGRGSGGMIGGRVAAKVCPDLLARLGRAKTCVIVTGTNGKSTTTRMITAALEASGREVASNRGGDNMADGVITALMNAPAAPFAVLEVDEMHVAAIARAIRPRALVYLNLSRDQLDRVGEISAIETRLRGCSAEQTQAAVIANCDDPIVTSAAWDSPRPVWVAPGAGWTGDSLSSPRGGGVIVREGENWRVSGDSGFARPEPAWWLERASEASDAPAVVDVVDAGTAGGAAGGAAGAAASAPASGRAHLPGRGHDRLGKITWAPGDAVLACRAGESFPVRIALPGRANRGNALMALAAAVELGVEPAVAVRGIESVSEVAGRYRVAELDGRRARLLLAKNPAGWQEALTMRAPGAATVVAVNGQEGDGVDLSWLWDVDFTQLREGAVIAAGERGRDLQVCLQYAGVDCSYIADPLAAVAACPAGDVDLLANYTAFRDTRVALINRGVWK